MWSASWTCRCCRIRLRQPPGLQRRRRYSGSSVPQSNELGRSCADGTLGSRWIGHCLYCTRLMYTEIVSYSTQARGFRPYTCLGVGALGVGVWTAAMVAGAGVASAEGEVQYQLYNASGVALTVSVTDVTSGSLTSQPTNGSTIANNASGTWTASTGTTSFYASLYTNEIPDFTVLWSVVGNNSYDNNAICNGFTCEASQNSLGVFPSSSKPIKPVRAQRGAVIRARQSNIGDSKPNVRTSSNAGQSSS